MNESINLPDGGKPVDIIGLFRPQNTIFEQVQDENLTKIHYGINFSEAPISIGAYNMTDSHIINAYPRGVIFPITEFKKWDVDADFEDGATAVRDGKGRVMRTVQPGHIAAFLRRMWGDMGLHIIEPMIGMDGDKGLEYATLLNFSGQEWKNDAINGKLEDIIANSRDKKKLVIICEDLQQAIIKANGYQKLELSNRRQNIIDNVAGSLDPVHHLMCYWTGTSPADYEVKGDAQALAMQQMLTGIFGGMQPPPVPVPEPKQEGPTMVDAMSLLQRMDGELKSEREARKKLQEQFDALQKKVNK